VTARSVFQTVEDRDGMLQSMEAEPAEVMNEVMDRLAELLQRLQKRISRAA